MIAKNQLPGYTHKKQLVIILKESLLHMKDINLLKLLEESLKDHCQLEQESDSEIFTGFLFTYKFY